MSQPRPTHRLTVGQLPTALGYSERARLSPSAPPATAHPFMGVEWVARHVPMLLEGLGSCRLKDARRWDTDHRNRCMEVAVPRQKVLALDGWGEDDSVWDLLPSGPRTEAIVRCARLVLSAVQEEAVNDEEDRNEQ